MQANVSPFISAAVRKSLNEATKVFNVFGLHQQAGSEGAVENHGNIWKAWCRNCSHYLDLRIASPTEMRGVCLSCSGKLRTDVVLFGKMLPAGAFEKAVARAENCDICLIVGTSDIVYPVAALPSIAKFAGAFVVEINCEQTPFSEICDEIIKGKAGEVFPLL
ncbi:MAG: NAD-dependent deacetylase [Blastocatellia bacterium]|nr:NAD-dependent deacetylase [Blastocatellia bacterium]